MPWDQPTSTTQAADCEFCGRRAELEVTAFDTLVPLGAPRPVCRFCLGRPHRQEVLGVGAHRVRLTDLATGKTSTGHPSQLAQLLAALHQQLGQRTITAAIRVSSYASQPIELVCEGCGGAVTPSKGGVLAWQERPDGRRANARVLHGQACAEQAGLALRPGAWEDLNSLASLDLLRFDEESMGFLTDVELAWKQLKES
ncbi:MAG: hypothetical protein ABI333_07815 [bacterium]